jgi:alkylation response protein AidB-like acyl-CoA dehydrogenase
LEQLFEIDHFKEHSLETAGMVIESAISIADQYLSPFLVATDQQPADFLDAQISTHPSVAKFVAAYAESGLLSATFPLENGGQQLPKTIKAAEEYICMSAHNSMVMFTDLVMGAAGLILSFGTEEQKKTYLPPMLNGQCLATMCLTEPNAGSSLSEISTKATPLGDDSFEIKGQKIFISAGDQSFSNNIVHLVLAKLPDSPAGTKGISLFLVPKFLENGKKNGVSPIGIFHKMGQRATPAVHLDFGTDSPCIGFLLGQPNKGLTQMFQMMNAARLGVGLTGISIASAAYYASLAYAQQRVQGRAIARPSSQEQIPIVEHPDIKRMLLNQKMIVEGGLCLMLQCYFYLDLQKQIPQVAELVELLTPTAKTFGAEQGTASVNMGLQVLGGAGYTQDFVLEQLLRDARITPIYEGTTGIQALAVLGRQMTPQSLALWKQEIEITLVETRKHAALAQYACQFSEEINTFESTYSRLCDWQKIGQTNLFLADATIFLAYFSNLNLGWMWLKMATTAQLLLDNQNAEFEQSWLDTKINTMRFYFKYEFPKTKNLAYTLLAKEKITNLENINFE